MDKGYKSPKEIWFSLYAFLGTIPFAIIGMLQSAFSKQANLTLLDVYFYLIETVITILLMLLILRRKNWARIAYTILNALALIGVFMIREETIHEGIYSIILLSLQVCLRLISVYYLFTKQSLEWFKTPCLKDTNAQPVTTELTVSSNQFPLTDNESTVNPSGPNLNSSNGDAKTTTNVSQNLKEKRKVLFVSVLVFCICFILIFICFGRRAKSTSAIRNAIIADIALNKKIFGGRSTADCDAKTINAYAKGLREIDMSDCPRDFQLAYLDHLHAWESLARSRGSADIVGIVIKSLVMKSLPDIPDEQPIYNEIDRTWEKVERIALSYGVRMPK